MLTKIIFTIVIAYLAWKAFGLITRIQDQRAKRADEDLHASEAQREGVEDMVECPTCKTYTPRGSKSCGKVDCPFDGPQQS